MSFKSQKKILLAEDIEKLKNYNAFRRDNRNDDIQSWFVWSLWALGVVFVFLFIVFAITITILYLRNPESEKTSSIFFEFIKIALAVIGGALIKDAIKRQLIK